MINRISERNAVNTKDGVMNKILMKISVLALFLFIVLACNHFLNGRHGLGIGISLIVFGFAANVWSLKYSPKLSHYIIFFGLTPMFVIALGFIIHIQKIIGVLWSFPAIVAFYYFLPEIKARIANLTLIIFTFPIIWNALEIELVIRIYLTMILVSLLAAVSIKFINEQELELKKSATTDFLTGALNRTRLQDILEEVISQNHRTNIPMTLLALDLDYFKKINDEYGHVKGDEVLKDVGAIFKQRCRKVDKIFRSGGEEFLILLYNTKLDSAFNVAEDLRKAVSNINTLLSRKITISIGVAELEKQESYTNWIKRADDKLYLAKENGRNRTER